MEEKKKRNSIAVLIPILVALYRRYYICSLYCIQNEQQQKLRRTVERL